MHEKGERIIIIIASEEIWRNCHGVDYLKYMSINFKHELKKKNCKQVRDVSAF